MLEAEVSRQILIDLEQQPDSSPQLVLNLRPELYGVSGSTLREQSRQRWYYLVNLRENRPAAYRQILKSQRLEEAQSSKSEEKVWWEEEAKSRNTSWSAHRSPKNESAGQYNDSDSEDEDSEEVDSEEEEDSKETNTRKNMSFSSPPTTRSKAKRGSTMAPSPSPYRGAPSSSYRDMDEAILDGKQICS
jgi:hypothetical protein